MNNITIQIYEGIEVITGKAANPTVYATCKDTGISAFSSASKCAAKNEKIAIERLKKHLTIGVMGRQL